MLLKHLAAYLSISKEAGSCLNVNSILEVNCVFLEGREGTSIYKSLISLYLPFLSIECVTYCNGEDLVVGK